MKKINKISNQNLRNIAVVNDKNNVKMAAQNKKSPKKIIEPKPNPTRYGDWEMKGRCIDF